MDDWLNAVFQWLHQRRSDTSQIGPFFKLIPKLLFWYNDVFLITFLNKHKLTRKQYSKKESNKNVQNRRIQSSLSIRDKHDCHDSCFQSAFLSFQGYINNYRKR